MAIQISLKVQLTETLELQIPFRFFGALLVGSAFCQWHNHVKSWLYSEAPFWLASEHWKFVFGLEDFETIKV
jgi:hypothetical protein